MAVGSAAHAFLDVVSVVHGNQTIFALKLGFALDFRGNWPDYVSIGTLGEELRLLFKLLGLLLLRLVVLLP